MVKPTAPSSAHAAPAKDTPSPVTPLEQPGSFAPDFGKLDGLAPDFGAPAWLEPEEDQLPEEEETSLEAILEASRLPFAFEGQTHHIEVRQVEGQLEVGAASTWQNVTQIWGDAAFAGNQAAVQNEYNTAQAAQNTATARQATLNQRSAAEQNLQMQIVNLTNPGYVGPIRRHSVRVARGQGLTPAQQRRLTRLRADYAAAMQRTVQARANLDQAVRILASAALAFVRAAARANVQVVSRILGANLPDIELASNLSQADIAATRYHEGTQADPIPLVWYKPENQYPDPVTVSRSDTDPTQVNLRPFHANAAVTVAGVAYTFRVAQANRVQSATYANPWQNLPNHGLGRANQQRYNQVLTTLGYNMHNQDGDHVRDLGFGGQDQITNFWPLPSDTNRRAFNGWRSQYFINYKKDQDVNGNWNIVGSQLNSAGLAQKYFYVKATENRTLPNENHTRNAGSDTGHGVRAGGPTILDQNGVARREG